ncbi:hypothetical protein Hanom_Chr03g00222321 [Helianthus anomalus]
MSFLSSLMTDDTFSIDQAKNRKSKDSRSMKLFKIAFIADKVSGAMKKHRIPKSQTKINHYIDFCERKLTKLVMVICFNFLLL